MKKTLHENICGLKPETLLVIIRASLINSSANQRAAHSVVVQLMKEARD